MESQPAGVTTYLASHNGPTPLPLPHPGDEGSARVLAGLVPTAAATTSSSGFAR